MMRRIVVVVGTLLLRRLASAAHMLQTRQKDPACIAQSQERDTLSDSGQGNRPYAHASVAMRSLELEDCATALSLAVPESIQGLKTGCEYYASSSGGPSGRISRRTPHFVKAAASKTKFKGLDVWKAEFFQPSTMCVWSGHEKFRISG